MAQFNIIVTTNSDSGLVRGILRKEKTLFGETEVFIEWMDSSGTYRRFLIARIPKDMDNKKASRYINKQLIKYKVKAEIKHG